MNKPSHSLLGINDSRKITTMASQIDYTQLVSIRDPSECDAHNEVKAGVKTFIICSNILTRTARHMQAESAPAIDYYV